MLHSFILCVFSIISITPTMAFSADKALTADKTTTKAAASSPGRPLARLTAVEIVDRNTAARGGLTQWRSIFAMRITGEMEAGGNNRPTLPMPGRKEKDSMPKPRTTEQVRLPFVMELKRPRKMRVEVTFAGQNAIQVFDGSDGYKLRPFLNRREVEPYTSEEMKLAASQAELDGLLIDYAAKGTTLELAGTEAIDGHDNYKLKLSMKNGAIRHIWIDGSTFLETKMEGDPRRLDGRDRPVEIYFQDYRKVGAVQVPFLLETRVYGSSTPAASTIPTATEKMVLGKVELNPSLNDALFSKADLMAAAANRSASARLSTNGSR